MIMNVIQWRIKSFLKIVLTILCVLKSLQNLHSNCICTMPNILHKVKTQNGEGPFLTLRTKRVCFFVYTCWALAAPASTPRRRRRRWRRGSWTSPGDNQQYIIPLLTEKLPHSILLSMKICHQTGNLSDKLDFDLYCIYRKKIGVLQKPW